MNIANSFAVGKQIPLKCKSMCHQRLESTRPLLCGRCPTSQPSCLESSRSPPPEALRAWPALEGRHPWPAGRSSPTCSPAVGFPPRSRGAAPAVARGIPAGTPMTRLPGLPHHKHIKWHSAIRAADTQRVQESENWVTTPIQHPCCPSLKLGPHGNLLKRQIWCQGSWAAVTDKYPLQTGRGS